MSFSRRADAIRQRSSPNRRLSSNSYCHESVIFFVFFGLIFVKLRRVCVFLRCQQCVKFWWWPSDPIIFLKRFKIVLRCFTGTAHHSRDAATGFAAVTTRSRAGCWNMEDRHGKSLIKWPYEPKHSLVRQILFSTVGPILIISSWKDSLPTTRRVKLIKLYFFFLICLVFLWCAWIM